MRFTILQFTFLIICYNNRYNNSSEVKKSNAGMFVHKDSLDKLTKLSSTLGLITKKLTFPPIDEFYYKDEGKPEIKYYSFTFKDFKVDETNYVLSNYENTLKISSTITTNYEFSITYTADTTKPKQFKKIDNCVLTLKTTTFDIEQKFVVGKSSVLDNIANAAFTLDSSQVKDLTEEEKKFFDLGLANNLNVVNDNISKIVNLNINSIVDEFYKDKSTIFQEIKLSMKEKDSNDIDVLITPIVEPTSEKDYMTFNFLGSIQGKPVNSPGYSTYDVNNGDFQLFVSNDFINDLVQINQRIFLYTGYLSKVLDIPEFNLNFTIQELGEVIPEIYFQYTRNKKYVLVYDLIEVNFINQKTFIDNRNDAYLTNVFNPLNFDSKTAQVGSTKNNIYLFYNLDFTLYLANSEIKLFKFDAYFVSEVIIKIVKNNNLTDLNLQLGKAKHFTQTTDEHFGYVNDYLLRDWVVNKFNNYLKINPKEVLAKNSSLRLNCNKFQIVDDGILFFQQKEQD